MDIDNQLEESYNLNDIEMECANEGDLDEQKAVNFNKLPKVEAKPKPLLQSKALRWHMPIIGEVPMSKYKHQF